MVVVVEQNGLVVGEHEQVSIGDEEHEGVQVVLDSLHKGVPQELQEKNFL